MEEKYFENREEFRNWLAQNHSQSSGIWLVYYKKHTKKASIIYDEAVEEAICFGWIDSTIRRIDDERYMQKFTPRNFKSGWSELNLKRANKMIAEGKMNKAGEKKLNYFLSHIKKKEVKNNKAEIPEKLEIPGFFAKELKKHPRAAAHFDNLAPVFRKEYILWLTFAKRDDTKKRRLKEAIEKLMKGEKLGMK